MKERPILFSGPMVLAILEGRKGVTRRVVKPVPQMVTDRAAVTWEGDPAVLLRLLEQNGRKCPHGRPGDRLWVREAFRDARAALAGRVLYRASGDIACGWKPGIHMPRWASRLLLQVSSVRVERLQAGEGETAFESRYLSEGINRIHHGDGEYYYSAFRDEPHPQNWCDPFDAWRELWVSINGVESWDENPWVWVVEFSRLEAAHD